MNKKLFVALAALTMMPTFAQAAAPNNSTTSSKLCPVLKGMKIVWILCNPPA
jgi:hypothetical protein